VGGLSLAALLHHQRIPYSACMTLSKNLTQLMADLTSFLFRWFISAGIIMLSIEKHPAFTNGQSVMKKFSTGSFRGTYCTFMCHCAGQLIHDRFRYADSGTE
jgi:hypothetical protein